jgi:NAD(P)H-dependent FMN reductase
LPKLHVVLCSTRPGRVGAPVSQWFFDLALKQGDFDVRLVDLADVALPIFDEPRHPRLQQYEHAHTKRWSETVAAADAFVFVTPEYNFGPPPPLLNALNYLYVEWNYKPVAFVSYGGISGGLRSVQVEKLTVTTLKMVPIVEAVALPHVARQIEDGVFKPSEQNGKAAGAMLAELLRWTNALMTLRK